VLGIVVITILNDGCMLTIARDHVVPAASPQDWCAVVSLTSFGVLRSSRVGVEDDAHLIQTSCRQTAPCLSSSHRGAIDISWHPRHRRIPSPNTSLSRRPLHEALVHPHSCPLLKHLGSSSSSQTIVALTELPRHPTSPHEP
jgi:hypothetical protein